MSAGRHSYNGIYAQCGCSRCPFSLRCHCSCREIQPLQRLNFLSELFRVRASCLFPIFKIKKATSTVAFLILMAGVTRLELATSCVTGRRSNQLSYTPTVFSNNLITNKKNKSKHFFQKIIKKLTPLSYTLLLYIVTYAHLCLFLL